MNSFKLENVFEYTQKETEHSLFPISLAKEYSRFRNQINNLS